MHFCKGIVHDNVLSNRVKLLLFRKRVSNVLINCASPSHCGSA